MCLLKSQTKLNGTASSFFCLTQRRTRCVSESEIYLISIIYFALFALRDLCTACGRTKVQTGRFNVKAKPLNEKFSIINNIANFKQI